jgi:uncharacterized protein
MMIYKTTDAVVAVGQKIASKKGSNYAVLFICWNGEAKENEAKIKHVLLLHCQSETTIRISYSNLIRQLNEDKLSIESFAIGQDIGLIN